MKIGALKTYFSNALLGYYPKDEIMSFFYLLSEHFLNMNRVDVSLKSNEQIKGTSFESFHESIERLKAYEPIQYILGETEFFGLKFWVNNAVLIPRPETEELIDWIIKKIKTLDPKPKAILDIGSGSGCIAISLAKNLTGTKVFSLDISTKALKIAAENAERNNATVEFVEADILSDGVEDRLLEQIDLSKFDIIVSNPPYVRQSEKPLMQKNVLNYEPHLAMFVEDEDALVFYRRIVELSDELLKVGGLLFFEINEGLGADVIELMEEKFMDIELRKDIFDKDRMIKGIKK